MGKYDIEMADKQLDRGMEGRIDTHISHSPLYWKVTRKYGHNNNKTSILRGAGLQEAWTKLVLWENLSVKSI